MYDSLSVNTPQKIPIIDAIKINTELGFEQTANIEITLTASFKVNNSALHGEGEDWPSMPLEWYLLKYFFFTLVYFQALHITIIQLKSI